MSKSVLQKKMMKFWYCETIIFSWATALLYHIKVYTKGIGQGIDLIFINSVPMIYVILFNITLGHNLQGMIYITKFLVSCSVRQIISHFPYIAKTTADKYIYF